MIVTGRIVFDVTGHHWLESFDGTFLVPQSTMEETAQLLLDQGVNCADLEVAGRVARGRVVESQIVDLTYLVSGDPTPVRFSNNN